MHPLTGTPETGASESQPTLPYPAQFARVAVGTGSPRVAAAPGARRAAQMVLTIRPISGSAP